MSLKNLFAMKHELWLKYQFCSFSIDDCNIKNTLQDFANIEFRHLKWLGKELVKNGFDFDFNRNMLTLDHKTYHEVFAYLENETKLCIKHYDSSNPLFARMVSDEYLFMSILKKLSNEDNKNITAYNKKRVYPGKNLDKTSIDALTLFLFEESYKEYELILVYLYMQLFSSDKFLSDVYQDLVDESLFHLKSFGNMLSLMGILSVPRIIPEDIYKTDDIKEFFLNGIEEEKAAKEECKKLSQAVKDEELSKFFDFINFQEDYHIKLMESVVDRLNKS